MCTEKVFNKSKQADLVKLSPFSLAQKNAANFTKPVFEALGTKGKYVT
jgi:hypothetical protein